MTFSCLLLLMIQPREVFNANNHRTVWFFSIFTRMVVLQVAEAMHTFSLASGLMTTQYSHSSRSREASCTDTIMSTKRSDVLKSFMPVTHWGQGKGAHLFGQGIRHVEYELLAVYNNLVN